MDTLVLAVKIAAYAVAGTVVFLHGVAPLTKSDWDNKLLDKLRAVEAVLLKLMPGK